MIGRALSRFRGPARRLKRRFVASGVILMYHRVAELRNDPWKLAVSPEHFDQQLQLMRCYGVRLMTVADLAASLSAGQLPRRSVAISFDDGYLDNLTAARPLLERHDAPATVFVTAGEVGTPAGFWWDRLAEVLLDHPSLPARLELRERSWPVPTDPAAREELHHAIWELVSSAPAAERDGLVAEVALWAGAADSGGPPARMMNEPELRRLGDGGLVEIASHGLTHSRFGDLSEDRQREEFVRSRSRLQDILNTPIVGFSFPHGSRSAGSATLARECGYAYACGSRPATVKRSADLFDLPRLVVENWGADQFERFLRDNLLS